MDEEPVRKGNMDCSSVIYAIRLVGTERLYIGSAVRFYYRVAGHRSKLRKQTHANQKLQNAWNKYGEDALEFIVVQRVDDKHDLIFWEQFWIDKLKPSFNISPVAGSSLGRKMSPEAIEKTRQHNKGRVISLEQRAASAERMRGRVVPPETGAKISTSNMGRRNSRESMEITWASSRGMKRTPKHRAIIANARAKEWVFLSPSGSPTRIFNLLSFCRDNALTESSMRHVNSGRRLQHKGWRRYLDDDLRGAGEEGSNCPGYDLHLRGAPSDLFRNSEAQAHLQGADADDQQRHR